MKTLILILISFSCFAQYPQRSSTLTITEKILHERTKTTHGFIAGDWLTVDGSGVFQKGSDPDTQKFQGIVHSAPTANTFLLVKPGGTVTGLSGLVAGQTYFAQTDGTIGLTATAMPVGIATSTSTLELLFGNFGTTLPPPSIQATIGIAGVTSTTMTGSGAAGNGDGRIFLASASPISATPSNNVPYTANLNFGSGDNINGAGVYVVGFGDITSVVITGLNAGTTYYITVFEFVQQGNFITYNLTGGFNSTASTTLSDATTPDESWETISTKSKQTSIEVTGTRGNGDNIVVVANDSIPVSIDISDGTDPVAGSFGSGTHLGNRNYVVYEGSSSTFSIDGLQRDDQIWFKVYEREDTGFLYNTLSTVDSAYCAWAYRNTFLEGTGDPPGLTYLTGSSNVWYDFSDLTFADEANITNGDAGLVDQGPNTNTAVISGTPVTNEITFNGTQKAARTTSTSAISTGVDGDAFFNTATGFEIHWSGQLADGRVGTSGQFYGLYGTNNNSSVVYLRIFDSGTAQLQLRDGVAASATVWAAGAFVDDGPQTFVFQVRVDLVNDIVTFYKDGTPFTSGYQSGTALSAQDFTNFNATNVFVVGNINQTGSLIGNNNGSNLSTAQFAITGLLTDEERDGIHDEFAFTAAAGAAFDDWDVIETDAYTQETINDTLNLSGAVSGFDNFMRYVEFIPDSLEDFDVVIGYKISAALTTNPSGIGVGFINSTSDPNYSAYGHINNDTNAGQFGKLELFTGNGATGLTNVTFRSASSGAFVPAEDSVDWIKLSRKLIGNDVFYSLTGTDLVDTLTTGYTEPNRPSSSYFADQTVRPVIWYQGPAYKVFEFYVIRTSNAVSGTAPPPTPTTYDFRADLVNGSDANPCTDALPCLSFGATLAAATASGGSGKTIGLSAGEFIITSNAVVTTNIGLIEGAGMSATKISGAPNLNGGYGYLSSSRALIQLISPSNTVVNQTLRNFTVSGGVAGQRDKTYGMYIWRRSGTAIGNGPVVENVRFEYFNSGGLWIVDSDYTYVKNCVFHETGGNSQPDATGYQRTYIASSISVGALNLYGPATGFKWEGGSVDGTAPGAGYGFKSGGGLYNSQGDQMFEAIEIDGVDIELYKFGLGSNHPDNNFAIEFHGGIASASSNNWGHMGDLDIHGCYFYNGALSLVTRHQSESSSAQQGSHAVYENEFNGETDFAWYIEADMQNLSIHHNWIHASRSWFIAQFPGTSGKQYLGHYYGYNLVEVGSAPSSNHRFLSTQGTHIATIIEHNNFNFQSTSGGGYELITLSGSGAVNNQFTVQNNAFFGDPPGSGNQLFTTGTGSWSSTTIRNNLATHINTLQTATGITGGSGQNNQTGLNGSAWFNFTGIRWPVTLGTYYALPGAGSALWNAGNTSTDVGIYQHE